MSKLVGLFSTQEAAKAAVDDLLGAGVPAASLGMMLAKGEEGAVPDQGENAGAFQENGDVSGTLAGSAIGGALGGALGFLAGTALMVVPGVGTVLGAGTIAAAFGGAGLGALCGGSIGRLTDLGLTEEAAQHSFEGLGRGGVVVTVEPGSLPGGDGPVEEVFRRHGASMIDRTQDGPTEDGLTKEGLTKDGPAMSAGTRAEDAGSGTPVGTPDERGVDGRATTRPVIDRAGR